MIGVQGAFYGASLPAAQIEALIAAHVPRKHIGDVADVFQARWWDYRRMSPGHSFYLFAHHYYRSSQFAARKFVSEANNQFTHQRDRNKARGIVGAALTQMHVEDVWEREQAHITGLWKSMLIADSFGVPYPEFVRLACRIAFDQLWKKVPRPSQLYSDKLAALVIDEWESLRDQRLFAATHPLYSEQHYLGLAVQDQYREWLIDRIQAQSSPLNALMTAIYVSKQLPEALALQHFPQQIVNRARLLAM